MRAHAGRLDSNEICQLPPIIKRPNLHIVRYTCQCEQYQLLTQNERRAHPNWAPTREPKLELLEVYSNPKQDPLSGPPESYLSRLLAHKFKPNKITILFIPTYLSRSCVVYAQNSILCQFGPRNLSSVHQLISHQFSSIFGGNCIRLTSLIARLPS